MNYKCFKCGSSVKNEYVGKRIRCPYCGSRIIYKARTTSATVKAI